MLCPKCKSIDTKVIDSRLTDKNTAIRRRRECEKCFNRFTTFERVELSNFVVQKKDGTREPYDRIKLEHGIWVACSKRPVTHDQVSVLINELEEKWANKKEVSSEVIGKDIMNRLKGLDNIAYIRFASVYKDFRDIEEFKDVINKVQ